MTRYSSKCTQCDISMVVSARLWKHALEGVCTHCHTNYSSPGELSLYLEVVRVHTGSLMVKHVESDEYLEDEDLHHFLAWKYYEVLQDHDEALSITEVFKIDRFIGDALQHAFFTVSHKDTGIPVESGPLVTWIRDNMHNAIRNAWDSREYIAQTEEEGGK
jgi:hypothetical protein